LEQKLNNKSKKVLHKGLAKVLAFIDGNVEQPLSLHQLSELASVSRFHFHRLFLSYMGVTVFEYVQLVRDKRAGFQLAYRKDLKIIDIALQNGYQSPEAFSRGFKSRNAKSPRDVRNDPTWSSWQSNIKRLKNIRNSAMPFEPEELGIRITNTNNIHLAAFEHKGSPHLLGKSIQQFIQWRKSNQLSPSKHRTFNLVYDDPNSVPAADYRFDLAVEISDKSLVKDIPSWLVWKMIPAVRCAAFRHIGSDDLLGEKIRYLYSSWINENGVELADFPLFFERVSFFPDVTEDKMITDVYLPLM